MTFALHRRRLVGQRMPIRRKKRVVRDAQREKPLGAFKSGRESGEENACFRIYQRNRRLLENGSPGRIRTGDLSINSRMLYR